MEHNHKSTKPQRQKTEVVKGLPIASQKGFKHEIDGVVVFEVTGKILRRVVGGGSITITFHLHPAKVSII